MLDMRARIGAYDLAWVTLDTLRHDVAVDAWRHGQLPHLAALMGEGGWEERHSPGSFTWAAHSAFFAGFLPTPVAPGPHERSFALEFAGSQTIGPRTCLLTGAASVPEGLRALGYRTLCVGGVGFFNLQNPLGRALPSLFEEQAWRVEFGVTEPDSTRHQLEFAAAWLRGLQPQERAFVFVNVSALHQPNRFYVAGAADDSVETHAAALRYVDSQLPILFDALRQRGPAVCMIFSDHGTAYGEGGYVGHRVGHPVVWTVPFAEFELQPHLPPRRTP